MDVFFTTSLDNAITVAGGNIVKELA